MITIRHKQIIINDKPVLIMAGEIHYFRLDVADWQDRIDKLKDAGCNTVATYIPWVCHEEVEGQIDLTGKTRPELDLIKFIDLCQANDLYFFLRPGPFIMAEMKNEGIPHWVYEKYPEVLPTGWDRAAGTTKTIDYLAPNFLNATKTWFEAVMAIAKPRLIQNGGNIIAVQLDNEVGMLSWVSNTPDLTDKMLSEFIPWLESKYEKTDLSERYPFDLTNQVVAYEHIRSPKETYTSALHFDLGYFMRNRYAIYIDTLRAYCESFGIADVPFVVNIHGTGGGRGFTYPIGISQLYETYSGKEGYISGSDIYFGDLDMNTFQDLYIINGFMDAVHDEHQPLTSVEFNCGDGNFGETYGGRTDVSAVDLKARMCIAQGNRLLNYYLMAGGRNYRMDKTVGDGNDRVAFTGERHGFAAPIGPEGKLNYTYPRMKESIKTIMNASDKLATMNEEHDNVSFAFIPDYFMTEYRYPKSEKMEEIYANIQSNRAYGAWEIMGRAMLLAGYRFTAVDIQNKPLTVEKTPVLALPSAKYLHVHIQEKLVDYLKSGGKILLYGEIPLFDLEGNPCTILAEALGLTYVKNLKDGFENYLSLTAHHWAAPRPEMRVHHAQIFTPTKGEQIFTVYGTDESCGFDIPVEKGRIIALTMSYRCDIDLFKKALMNLGTAPQLTHNEEEHGIFMTSTITPTTAERFIHILNLDGFEKTFNIFDKEQPLMEGQTITLSPRGGLMLPTNVQLETATIHYATAEIINDNEQSITFKLTQEKDVIKLSTKKSIRTDDAYEIILQNCGTYVITPAKHGKLHDEKMTIYFD